MGQCQDYLNTNRPRSDISILVWFLVHYTALSSTYFFTFNKRKDGWPCNQLHIAKEINIYIKLHIKCWTTFWLKSGDFMHYTVLCVMCSVCDAPQWTFSSVRSRNKLRMGISLGQGNVIFRSLKIFRSIQINIKQKQIDKVVHNT